jgi:hypothetical protein
VRHCACGSAAGLDEFVMTLLAAQVGIPDRDRRGRRDTLACD